MSDDQDFFANEMFNRLGEKDKLTLLIEAQKRAALVGHKTSDQLEGYDPVKDLEGEIQELREAVEDPSQNKQRIADELADVLFNVINVARIHDIDIHNALDRFSKRWLTRKKLQEDKVKSAGYTWKTLPGEKSNQFWAEVKQELKKEEYR